MTSRAFQYQIRLRLGGEVVDVELKPETDILCSLCR